MAHKYSSAPTCPLVHKIAVSSRIPNSIKKVKPLSELSKENSSTRKRDSHVQKKTQFVQGDGRFKIKTAHPASA